MPFTSPTEFDGRAAQSWRLKTVTDAKVVSDHRHAAVHVQGLTCHISRLGRGKV